MKNDYRMRIEIYVTKNKVKLYKIQEPYKEHTATYIFSTTNDMHEVANNICDILNNACIDYEKLYL